MSQVSVGWSISDGDSVPVTPGYFGVSEMLKWRPFFVKSARLVSTDVSVKRLEKIDCADVAQNDSYFSHYLRIPLSVDVISGGVY